MTDPVAPVPPAAPVYAPVGPKTNTLAIVGFILAFVVSVAGIIVSALALRQIKQTGEGGHGLALAGVIIGIVGSVGWVVFWIIWIVYIVALGSVANGLSGY
jgi:Domain of unknown function (DUF4190)